MNVLSAVLIVLALIVVATVAGLVWQRRNGRVRSAAARAAEIVRPTDVQTEAPFGERATLLQFSTEFCTYCPSTRKLLGGIAERTHGVVHVDVDLTHSPELAQRFKVLQTPTTLLLDRDGAVRARVGGPPKRAELEEALARILNTDGDNRVAA